ncbi:hypothetical protein LTR01_009033 [Friedmanniomyces endolithicus]|nr:hypothetical protein LTR01_009033 [Friedmanniomyces endolithicus]KAK0822714.1 hypothetical protein LTR73_009093 [Friedmanniomyces endolithicus]
MHASKPTRARVTIPIDGKDEHFSPILLRDLCKCPVCIHEFTRQRLYSTTDLLYFDNPAHIQLLHCMQSSSTGGISVFVDAFKAALDLYAADIDAFNVLASLRVNYHYEHPASHLYHATKPVIDMRPLRVAHTTYDNLPDFLQASESTRKSLKRSAGAELPSLDVADCLEKINWGVPFLAPLTLNSGSMEQASSSSTSTRECLNKKMDDWHAAAKNFSALLGRPEGECVLFSNTRVLHARKAFDSSDVGKARWLRGTYVDKDPFLSKLRVLEYKSEEASRMALSKGCVDEVLA